MAVTAARLRELLDYDPETGVFKWRVKRKGVNPGDVAGCVKGKRYRHIQVDGVCYGAHRLAWLYVYGRFPIGLADHRNGDGYDNRIANLREADAKQNTHNRRGDSNSGTKIKGVSYRARVDRYEANIMASGEAHYLGQFKTADEASAAYRQAAQELHGEFARA